MVRYRRLTLLEREEVSRMLAVGASLRATARHLGRAPSTLARELARHRMSSLTYRAVPAHQRAQRRAHQPRRPRKLAVQPRLRTAVLRLLARRLATHNRFFATLDEWLAAVESCFDLWRKPNPVLRRLCGII